jgi:hypothetical protein
MGRNKKGRKALFCWLSIAMNNVYAQDLLLEFELDQTALIKVQQTINLNLLSMTEIDPADYDVNLVQFLKSVDLKIPHAEVFYTPPHCTQGIHVDGDRPGYNHAKINWVFGATNTYMKWWQPKLEIEQLQKVQNTVLGTDYLGYERKDCVLLHAHKIKTPSLVNAGIPHCADNKTSQGRWCVSYCMNDIDSDQHIQWDQAVKRLQPWFKL